MLRLVLLASVLLVNAPLFAETDRLTPAETEARSALKSFIEAFDNLDLDKFRLAFDDNATVFYPRGIPERATGRAAFEANFRKVFEQIRGNKTAAPYMDIQPKNFELQMFGDVAVATFHLDDRAGFLNRRTLVLAKTGNGWKIVHLHASEVALPGDKK